MKKLLIIEDTTANKLSYYHCCAFLVSLPFDRFYSQLILASFILHTLIQLRKLFPKAIFCFQNLILASVFLINLASLAWSPDLPEAGKDLQRQLAIILFPLVFSLSTFPFSRYRKNLLLIFAYSSVLTLLYLYADALRILLYYKLPVNTLFSLAFINHNFSSPIGIHATYLSLYVAFSILVFVWYLLEEVNKRNRIYSIIAILVLAAGLLQLASRSVLIGLAAALVCVPFYIGVGVRRSRFIVVSIVMIGLVLAGIFQIDSFRKRYVYGFREDLTHTSIKNESLEPRLIRWHCAWDLVTKKMVLGYGSGTEKKLLKEIYYERKLYNSYLNELNSHNQYLSIWLKSGLLGILVFLFTLGYGFLRAARSRDILFLGWMLLITIVSFSENILDVNKGIFFYAFFFSFFMYAGKPLNHLSRLGKQNPS
ncbi:MAG TPA: O-antigen ligase family protein [Chitinophagaceae bacterium]|nr:O-antigen ligase family protein [Chitinophagaceae bacterium]